MRRDVGGDELRRFPSRRGCLYAGWPSEVLLKSGGGPSNFESHHLARLRTSEGAVRAAKGKRAGQGGESRWQTGRRRQEGDRRWRDEAENENRGRVVASTLCPLPVFQVPWRLP